MTCQDADDGQARTNRAGNESEYEKRETKSDNLCRNIVLFHDKSKRWTEERCESRAHWIEYKR